MWWVPFIGPLLKAGEKVLDAFLPKNMSEAEKADFGLKFQALAFQEIAAAKEDLQDARKMAMKEMETDVWFVRLLRGLIRPVTAFVFVGLYVWAKVSIQFGYKLIELSERDYFIMGGIMAFYFGMRSFLDKKNGSK